MKSLCSHISQNETLFQVFLLQLLRIVQTERVPEIPILQIFLHIIGCWFLYLEYKGVNGGFVLLFLNCQRGSDIVV